MPSKHRQYTIVIHNVNEKSQPIVKQYAAQAKEYVMSIEPYPQGNGSHLHLFIQYSNPRSFRAVLNELERFKKRIVVPRPQDESRDWGRVQLDVMRGRFSQANSYLMGETKEKPIGEVVSHKKGNICLKYMFQPGGLLDGTPNPIWPEGFKISDFRPNPLDCLN